MSGVYFGDHSITDMWVRQHVVSKRYIDDPVLAITNKSIAHLVYKPTIQVLKFATVTHLY